MAWRSSTALLLAPVLLTGCLTSALWRWSDPDAVPELDATTTECRIDAVLVPPGEELQNGTDYAVAFTPAASARAPRHLAAQTADGPAWLWVRPRVDFPVAEAMDAFRPRGQAIDVFDGQQLRRRTNNVRLTLYGTVPVRAVGELLAPEAVPATLRTARLDETRIPPWGPARRALDGLRAQPWTRLLAGGGPPPPEGAAEPVAFLDAAGNGIDPALVVEGLIAPAAAPRAHALEGATLLARVRERDRTAFVKIPVPVLLNADAMTLQRDGGEIAFAWARRGVGRFVPVNALPRGLVTTGLPLVDRRLFYEWSTERSTEPGWRTPLQILLTPFTAALDFLIETNPPLRALRDALFPPPPGPVRPRGGQ